MSASSLDFSCSLGTPKAVSNSSEENDFFLSSRHSRTFLVDRTQVARHSRESMGCAKPKATKLLVQSFFSCHDHLGHQLRHQAHLSRRLLHCILRLPLYLRNSSWYWQFRIKNLKCARSFGDSGSPYILHSATLLHQKILTTPLIWRFRFAIYHKRAPAFSDSGSSHILDTPPRLAQHELRSLAALVRLLYSARSSTDHSLSAASRVRSSCSQGPHIPSPFPWHPTTNGCP